MKQICLLLLMLNFGLVFSQKKEEEKKFQEAKNLLYANPDQTIRISKNLLTKTQQPDTSADINLLISNAYFVKRNLDSSLYYINQATNLVNTTTKMQTKIKILNFVSMQYQQMELYDKALETIAKAEEFNNKLPDGGKDQILFAGLLNATKGMIYRSQANPELAVEKLKKAESLFRSLNDFPKNEANISAVLYNLGYYSLEMKQNVKAKSYFTEAIRMGQKSKTPSLEAFALKGLAENYFSTQNYSQSIAELKTAEKLAQNTQDLTLKEGIFNLMASNYYRLKDWTEFQKYDEKAQQLKMLQQQNELKSLNRYIDTYNQNLTSKIKRDQRNFLIYELAIILGTLLVGASLIRKILRLKKG